MIGWWVNSDGYRSFFVSSANAPMSAERVDALFPTDERCGGAISAPALAAYLEVGEDQLPQCVVGHVALRYALQWCAGLEKRRAEQLVQDFAVNGTITVTGELPWAKWDALVAATRLRRR